MNMQPDLQVLKELVPLRGGDTAAFLKSWREDALERCANAGRDAYEKIAGEVAVLGRLIEMIETSRTELDQRSKPKPNMQKAF